MQSTDTSRRQVMQSIGLEMNAARIAKPPWHAAVILFMPLQLKPYRAAGN